MKIINTLNQYKSLGFIISILIGAAWTIEVYAQDQEVEEVIVKGKVLYTDKVLALKTPVPIIDVPQSLSIYTDEDIKNSRIS